MELLGQLEAKALPECRWPCHRAPTGGTLVGEWLMAEVDLFGSWKLVLENAAMVG